MKKKQRKVLTTVFIFLFLLGAGLMFRQLLQYRAAEKARQEAQQLIQTAMQAQKKEEEPQPETIPAAVETVPEEATAQPVQTAMQQTPLEEEAQFLMQMDLTALQDVNEDVFGWIHITGSDISFPLLRSYDNEDYLYHAWDGSYSASGSIFLECKNNRNLLDFNTIIYGHHMRNGTVFAPIMNYDDEAYRDEHPYIYILTENGLRRYEVFSAYEADITSDTYRLYYPDEQAKLTALEHFTQSSVLEKGITPTKDDYILTLSTCTGTGIYDTRWVVQAVLTGIWVI